MNITRRQVGGVTWGICVLLVVIFNSSMNWLDGCALWHKLFVAAISVFGVAIFPLAVYKWPKLNDLMCEFIHTVVRWMKNVKDNWRDYALSLLGYVLIYVVIFVVQYVIYTDDSFNTWKYIFFCGCATLIITLFKIARNAYENHIELKVEKMFVVLALVIGLTTIFSSPRYIAISPDDDTHWARTASLVSVFDFVKYDSENVMFMFYADGLEIVKNHDYSYEQMKQNGDTLNELYGRDKAVLADVLNNADPTGYDTQLGEYAPAYVAPAVAMIIAKGLHLPYTAVFMAGKIGILLAFIAIMYAAIKRVKYGKILIALIGLSPTTLYWACSYSYDWWVLSWLVLAYAIFIGELQQPDKPISNKTLFAMFACATIGIIPKWVYIVLTIPFLFIPKYKFKDDKQRRWFYGIIAILAFISFMIYVYPVFTHGLGPGDTRGGEGINPSWQLWYIFYDKKKYLGLLTSFMLDFVNPAKAGGYLTTIGYLGTSQGGVLAFILLAVTAIVDRGANKVKSYKWARVVTMLVTIIGIAGICTVFYLIYTPVAADIINGCQPRYLIPFLLPFMYMLGRDGNFLSARINKNAYAIASISVMCLLYMVSYWNMYVAFL
ncbi:MAG: DUF2142 domain-containing protein [Lachnospiraceae bacterium]|nr:DUF2142 domain-containing protein [Lachnospiraceae bacterium]